MSEWISVAKAAELPNGRRKLVEVHERPIALFNIANQLYAMDSNCPHRGAPLVEGELDGTVVTCPWHGWEFDVTTGKSPINPSACVRKYNVKVEVDNILIEYYP